MVINKKLIDEIVSVFGEENKDDVLCLLLCNAFGIIPKCIPDHIKTMVRNSQLKNNVFEIKTDDKFSWVESEYISLFKERTKGLDKTHSKNMSISRMKRLFAENPDIRKDEVIEATKMYLNNTENRFIMYSHYFIEKGVGISKSNMILEWIEKYRNSNLSKEGRNNLSNIMQ